MVIILFHAIVVRNLNEGVKYSKFGVVGEDHVSKLFYGMIKLIAENTNLIGEKNLKIPSQVLTVIKPIYDEQKLKDFEVKKQ